MKHKTVIAICLTIAALALILLLTGCAYRHAVVGQCANVATTAWGRHEGLDEANPIVGDSLAGLVAIKAATLWLAYYLDDENVNAALAGAGWLAAGWDVSQIARSK
jgi:hypothetical protein